MDTTTIVLLIVFAALGAAAGMLIQRAQDRRPVPPSSPDSTPASAIENKLVSEGDIQILSAWRTLSGRLWLEMDGNRLNEKESLQPEQRRRLVNTVVELRPWLEKTPAVEAIAEILPTPVSPSSATAMAGKPVIEQVKPAPVLKSIVEQIDDVLQAALAGSPYQTRDIHLTEGPGGTVLVRDGLSKFEGIEAVPEPEIKAIIRQAVADWEKTSH